MWCFHKTTTANIDVSGRNDMHGISITLIGHLTKENTGTDPLPLTLDVSEDILIEPVDEFAAVPFIEDLRACICLASIQGGGQPTKTVCVGGIKEEAWLVHVMSITKKNEVDEKW